jgi:hypothetical protein
VLAPNIDLAGLVLADKKGGETHPLAGFTKRRYSFGHFGPNLGCYGLSVDYQEILLVKKMSASGEEQGDVVFDSRRDDVVIAH